MYIYYIPFRAAFQKECMDVIQWVPTRLLSSNLHI